MADLKKASAATESVVREAALSAEIAAKEEMKTLFEQQSREALEQRDQMQMQVCCHGYRFVPMDSQFPASLMLHVLDCRLTSDTWSF